MDFITSFLLSYRTEIMDELHYSHTYWIFLLPLVMIATDVVSGTVKVKTLSVATSNIGTASLDMLVTNATVLSVYSRTGVSGEYCRFTPYVVDTTWYVAAETSSGPVASTALDIVVYYIDKT